MKKLIKEVFRKILNQSGFEIVYRGYNSEVQDLCATNYAKQSHLSHLLKHLNINCVFDIGANKGQYVQDLRDFGYDGHIISFEPVLEAYSILENLASNDPKWHTYNFGLGSENRTDEINLFEESQLNSFLSLTDQGRELAKQYAPELTGNNIKKEVVEIRKLDSIYDGILKDNNIGNNCKLFIKIDTQGFDLEVINGGRNTLKKAIGLQSEISFIPIYDGTPSYIDSLQLFESLGFQVTNLFSVTRNKKSLATVEFDCFMTLSK